MRDIEVGLRLVCIRARPLAVPQVAAPAADAASEIRRSLERSGNPIGMADSLVAGIVTRNGGTLLTRNRRHFERVPGIRLA